MPLPRVWTFGLFLAFLVVLSPVQAEAIPKVALVMKSLANEFFLTMEKGAEKFSRENPGRFELLTGGIKDESDVQKQIETVELMISQGVSAVVLAPADSKALVPVCAEAMRQGIVIVNIDNRFDSSALREKGIRIPFVGPDNRKGAEKVGLYLADRLHPGDQVAIIEGISTAINALERTQGYRDAMDRRGVSVVSVQTGLWEMEKSSTVASALISEFPGLNAILCGNDSMALGAIAAVRAAGKSDSVYVVGFDNISASQTLLEQGRLLATANQHADRVAITGIELALSILGGERPHDVETSVDLVTR